MSLKNLLLDVKTRNLKISLLLEYVVAQAKKQSFWKIMRVMILLIVLASVAMNAWRDKNQDWSQPIFVVLYPINADQSQISQQYIQQLDTHHLDGITEYLQQQAQQYTSKPIQFYFRLGQQIQTLPPAVPENSSMINVVLWSLKFRYYAWKNQQNLGFKPSVSLFLTYYDPKQNPVLHHSTALENGRIGIVNLFSAKEQAAQNKVVITHELLHAFGAMDKYDLLTGQPLFPIGYADPQQQPLYPQKQAEIMAVAIPLSATKSKMADGLQQTLIHQQTATEIGWLKP